MKLTLAILALLVPQSSGTAQQYSGKKTTIKEMPILKTITYNRKDKFELTYWT